MTGSQIFGLAMVLGGAWWLFSGLILGDMGGITGLGYNPDVPLNFSRAPLRYLLGFAINIALIIYGVKKIRDVE